MATHEQDILNVVKLCAEDAAALDAIIEARAAMTLKPVTPECAAADARVDRIGKVLALLDTAPVDAPAADLVQRTLSRATEATHGERFAQQIDMLRPVERGGMLSEVGRWVEMGAAAAMIIIGLSLMFPVLEHNKSDARRVGCTANLMGAGHGFGSYAAANNGQLPRRNVTPGGTWIRVGDPVGADGSIQSNSAQLFLLIRQGFVEPTVLSCPENAHAVRQINADRMDWPNSDAVSFSYQNQYTAQAMNINENPRAIIVADRNPLFVEVDGKLVQDTNPNITKESPSRLHDQRGQNLLWADGTITWQFHPTLPDGDNIWTAEGIEHYEGNETSTKPKDVHLIP